jgi:hypothetical protein
MDARRHSSPFRDAVPRAQSGRTSSPAARARTGRRPAWYPIICNDRRNVRRLR